MESPTSPQSPQERPQRPRSKSAAFSFKSDKSVSSGGSKSKIKIPFGRETQDEKHRGHLSIDGKANPNAAMNEIQPIAAALEAPTIASLRSIQHVDSSGNPIAEPDLSNPTRPRWERPLDTIRSFEAAIDGEYTRRSAARSTRPNTAVFSDSGAGYNQSRRSSYFGALNGYTQQGRYSQAPSQFGGYYGRNRDSYYENEGYDNGYGYGPQQQPQMAPPAPQGRPRRDRRQHSEPMVNRYNNGEPVYPPNPGYQRSRDTVNTGVSNGSQSQSEPWTNNTDPSSENSSIDRINAAPKQDPGEQYGFTGFGGAPFNKPIAEEMAGYSEAGPPRNGPGNGPNVIHFGQPPPAQTGGPPPPPPPHVNYGPGQGMGRNTLRKLNSGGPPPVPGKDDVQVTARPALQSQPSQKRKSWLMRRFSKKD